MVDQIDPEGEGLALSHPLLLFAGKTAIVGVAVIVTIFISVSLISAKIEATLSNQLSWARGGPAFWGRIEHELDRLADPNATPPGAREQLAAKIRAAASNWAPLVIAIQEGEAAARERRPVMTPRQ